MRGMPPSPGRPVLVGMEGALVRSAGETSGLGSSSSPSADVGSVEALTTEPSSSLDESMEVSPSS